MNNSSCDIIAIIFCSRIIHFFINNVKFFYRFSRLFLGASAAAKTTFEIERFNSRILEIKKNVIKIQQKCSIRFFSTGSIQMQFDLDCQIKKKDCFSYQYENWLTNKKKSSLTQYESRDNVNFLMISQNMKYFAVHEKTDSTSWKSKMKLKTSNNLSKSVSIANKSKRFFSIAVST